MPVVISVPEDESALVDYARQLPVDRVVPGNPEDVVAQVYAAAKPYAPQVVIRGLPDCPYFDYEASMRRAHLLMRYSAAVATRSRHRFGRQPVYGADEPAYSWRLVEHMLGTAEDFEREHFGSFVDRRRTRVNLLWTPSPPQHLYQDFQRPYRLELDTEADLQMLRKLMYITGPTASVSAAVAVLERRPDLVRMNADIEEVTGPVISFVDFADEHEESYLRAYPIGDHCFFSLAEGLEAVFCSEARCFLGYRGEDGALHLLTGEQIRGGRVDCECGVGINWFWRPRVKKRKSSSSST